MTFHNFTDGDVLYAAQLNALAAALAADATSKDNVLKAQLETYADGAFWRGTIPSTGNLDTALEPGLYGYWYTSANAPGSLSGMLLVGNIGGAIVQRAWNYGSNPREFYRHAVAASSPFGPWQRVDGGDRLAALEQDTGWRNITGLITDHSVTAGRVLLRRIGRRVSVRVDNLVMAEDGGGVLAVIPSGFRPAFTESNTLQGISNRGQLSTGGNLALYFWTNAQIFGSIDCTTDQAFPSTLPGTPL